jgi:hypothetical protein
VRTIEELVEVREELVTMLGECEIPGPGPLWQLSDWCITMQAIVNIDFWLWCMAPSLMGRSTSHSSHWGVGLLTPSPNPFGCNATGIQVLFDLFGVE